MSRRAFRLGTRPYPSHLYDAGFFDKGTEIRSDPSIILKEDEQALGIQPVDVLIDAVLLHDEDRRTDSQDLIQLPRCQIVE